MDQPQTHWTTYVHGFQIVSLAAPDAISDHYLMFEDGSFCNLISEAVDGDLTFVTTADPAPPTELGEHVAIIDDNGVIRTRDYVRERGGENHLYVTRPAA